jgi:hypothetical protein
MAAENPKYRLAEDADFKKFIDFADGDDGWQEVYRDDAQQTVVFSKKVCK